MSMEYTLNYVRGFDPEKYIEDALDRLGIPIMLEDGETPLRYMSTEGKKLWFRMVYPNGAIITTREERINPLCIAYRADIYLDKEDAMPVASWEHQETTASTESADNLVSKIQTIAVGKALSAAGFGAEIEALLHLKAEGEIPEKPVEEPKKRGRKKAKVEEPKVEKPKVEEPKDETPEDEDIFDEVSDTDPLDVVIQPTGHTKASRIKRLVGKTFKEALEMDKDIASFILKPGNKIQVTEDTLEAAKKVIA